MNSLILRTTARLLISLLLIFSIVLLLRGHDSPGGGFSGGLVAPTAWALYSLAFGAVTARKNLGHSPQKIFGIGLILSLVCAILPMTLGKPFLTGLWLKDFSIGTPIIFDVGVYLVILGVVIKIILSIEEEE